MQMSFITRTFLTLFCFFTVNLTAAVSPYAAIGVRTSKSGAEISSYSYDAAGNQIAHDPAPTSQFPQQQIAMGLVTKPVSIKTNRGNAIDIEIFDYGVSGKRYLRKHADGRKTLYIGNVQYRIPAAVDAPPTSTVHIHPGGYSPKVQVNVSQNQSPQYDYFVQDHLGSPGCWVDGEGNTIEQTRFDPWGNRTQPNGIAQDTSGQQEMAETIPGYTGHETIASAGLIHMNGRIFRPGIGLFLGPDIFVQGRSIASLNRYSLGHSSNPNVTDPTGWRFTGRARLTTRFERFFHATDEAARLRLNALEQQRVDRVRHHMPHLLDHPIPVEELAPLAGISEERQRLDRNRRIIHYALSNEVNVLFARVPDSESYAMSFRRADSTTLHHGIADIRFENPQTPEAQYEIEHFARNFEIAEVLDIQHNGPIQTNIIDEPNSPPPLVHAKVFPGH